jgi:glycosyltransferase involved in cell wall biosynthesis
VKYFNFKDNIPTFLLDMGVNDSVLVHRTRKACEKRFDFCYIGAMIAERKIEVMIDSFLSRYDKRKTLVLVGDAAPYLLARYSKNMNVIFLGKVRQSKVFDLINLSSVCVAYFPNHFPHIIQTPTKLLEYAVLGAKILANDQIMNRRKAEQFGMRVVWGPAHDIFNNAPETFDWWPDNYDVDPAPMLWSSQLRQSGVQAILEDPDNYFADGHASSSHRVI